MPVEGTLVRSTSGAHLVSSRDAAGNLVTAPAFPTLAGGTPIGLLAVAPTPSLATIAAKLNEMITRLNAIIVATGLSS